MRVSVRDVITQTLRIGTKDTDNPSHLAEMIKIVSTITTMSLTSNVWRQ